MVLLEQCPALQFPVCASKGLRHIEKSELTLDRDSLIYPATMYIDLMQNLRFETQLPFAKYRQM